MVGVESVAQAEHVGDETEADQCRIVRRVVQIQPPSESMEYGNETIEAGKPAPFVKREREPIAPSARRPRDVDVFGHGYLSVVGAALRGLGYANDR